jgi:hypothetical protein
MNNSDDLSPFDRERIDAITTMLVEHAARRPDPRRPHRIALFVSLIVTAVLVSTGGAALALTGRLPFVPPPAPLAATTPPAATSTPIPSPTPTDSAPATPSAQVARLNGFDLDDVYQACNAAVPADTWGRGQPESPQPPNGGSFGIASSDPYTADHTNGDPHAIYVVVTYMSDQTHGFSAVCVASGDTATPTVQFLRTLD